LGDPSILPTYLLSRFTRQHVTVALSGDGGDELFAGYDPFLALRPASYYERLVPWVVHRNIRKLADLLPKSARNMSLDFRIRRTLAGLSYPRALWNPVWMAPIEPDLMADLFEEPLTADELYSEAITLWDADSKLDILDRSLAFFTNFYLTEDILMKVDRATMMHSLESRAVFLDNDLVAFCQRLPNRFKFRNGNRKYLLKKAMEGMLPDNILKRRKKGFGIPLAQWLRDSAAVPPAAPLAGANNEWALRQWHEHHSGKADHRLFLWSWLSLQTVLGNYRSAEAAIAA
jgi:asparagine synthase (glutamine-hydrolysing)